MRSTLLLLGVLTPVSALAGPVDSVLEKLGTSSNGCPEEFDYFPNGGMRNFYCHAKTVLSYEGLGKLAGMPIFIYGPHSPSALALSSESSFGSYNPQFVEWLARQVMTAARDPRYRAATQPVYDRYVRPLARLYLSTLRELEADPSAMARAVSGYRNYRSMEVPTSSALYNQEPNLYPPARAWWIRRTIDETSDEFKKALIDFLTVYDPSVVAGSAPPPSGVTARESLTGTYVAMISGALSGPLRAGPVEIEDREGQLILRSRGTVFVGRALPSMSETQMFHFAEDKPRNVVEIFAGTVNANRFTGTWIDHLGRKGTFTLTRQRPPPPPPPPSVPPATTGPIKRPKAPSAKDMLKN